MTDKKIEQQAMANMKKFIGQGYTMAETATVETITDISFEDIEIDINEEFIAVEEVINECMTDNLLEKVYRQEPTYMVFHNEKMIKDSITYKALIEFIAGI